MDNGFINLDDHAIDLTVGYQPRCGNYYAASLTVGAINFNAPADTPQRAVLQAWTSYTAYLTTTTIIREQALNRGTTLPVWPSRLGLPLPV